ncbi:hypothetical protein BH24ACT22_BH24ACT22_01660 [soil metagenome]
MISVTEEAKELFIEVDRPEGTVLRLDPVMDEDRGQTQISLGAGEELDGDQVIEHAGENILYISAPISDALDGSTIDRVETPEGPGIGIAPAKQPNP